MVIRFEMIFSSPMICWTNLSYAQNQNSILDRYHVYWNDSNRTTLAVCSFFNQILNIKECVKSILT